jgi:predicted DNA binding CopG/RHH family protein
MKYDKEEIQLLEDYENGIINVRNPSKTEIQKIQKAARNTFRKDKRITIRLYDHDLKGIQKKALEMGIPYQTLISGIIHRYVEGDLVEK